MTPTPEVQETLRRYLLGQLSDSAREEIEKELLDNDELFEELLMIESEITDDYLAGKLSEDERLPFEKLFLTTPERQQQLRFGRAFKRYLTSQVQPPAIGETRQFGFGARTRSVFSTPLGIAAFAILVVGIAFGVWRIFFHQSEVEKGLLALNSAFRNSRPIEPRISDLSHAPYIPTRGASSAADQDKLRLAELDFKEALNNNPTPEAHHALGKAYLARGELDRAIEQFEEARKGEPRDARLFNDLGVAWMQKGFVGPDRGQPQTAEVSRGLGYLNDALSLNPNLAEAVFNRALSYEYLGRIAEARQDWQRYSQLDPGSPWTTEAREHLQKFSEQQR